MTSKTKTRIIMAKFGLDGHSNGIRIVTRWLQDAGFEVIYMGLYNTAEGIIKALDSPFPPELLRKRAEGFSVETIARKYLDLVFV